MAENPKYILAGNEDPIYPGYRGGYSLTHNLTTYREEPVFSGTSIVSAAVKFDIERWFAWDEEYNLSPFAYSMMIDGYYPLGILDKIPWIGRPGKPTIEEFRAVASNLEGFVINQNRKDKDYEEYRNVEWMLRINFSYPSRGKICIGVIQNTKVADLAIVTDQIVPYAVEVFNKLSPTRKISDDVVRRSVELAKAMNEITPRCRVVRS